MSDFDKNFHINFSPLYAAFVFSIFMLWASEAKASEIEEVIVVAQQERTAVADPIDEVKIIDAILPAFTYNPGGTGGFIGYAERGAQTIHTSVIVNGVPANDPGAGWYDFGHEFSAGQEIKIVTGANGVLYGSGSIAGTVLIKDTIEKGITFRSIGEPSYIRVAPIDQLEFSLTKDGRMSARNDNDERDNYTNKAVRFNVDFGDFSIVGKFADYEYEYDNCWDYDWNNSNDCVQDGKRYNIAIRNDYVTFGRNYNNADYFTNDYTNDGTYFHQDQTYANESYRDFIRVGNTMELSNKINVAFGFDAEKIYYNTSSWSMVEGSTEVQTEILEPGIYYGDDDTNKNRPLWTGEYIGTGEYDISYVGDGVFTLTEEQNKYTDENGGLYFQANANFILDYNFGIRVGNDDQNALRLGIKSGEWFFNVGNSFRKPNLYELNGDGFVNGDPDLEPEEGIGYEFGYGAISVFRYEFEQAIQYVPGYYNTTSVSTIQLDAEATLFVDEDDPTNSGPGIGCVLDPNWNDNDAATFDLQGCIYALVTEEVQDYVMPTYANTGSYVTQGIRYNNNFGPVSIHLKWTDTDQPRVPEYAGAIKWQQTFYDIDFGLKYAVNLNRKPGDWDFIDGEFLEDLEKINFYLSKVLDNGVTVAFRIENLTDQVVEVVPYYNNNGREVYLTIDYKW